MRGFIYAPQTTHHTTRVEMVDPSVEKGARFLNEVQTKAGELLVSRQLIGTTEFDANLVRFEMWRDVSRLCKDTYIAFKVNGREYSHRMSTPEGWHGNPTGEAEEMFHQIATAITAKIMEEVFLQFPWRSL